VSSMPHHTLSSHTQVILLAYQTPVKYLAIIDLVFSIM
jgi:hypothetical protein